VSAHQGTLILRCRVRPARIGGREQFGTRVRMRIDDGLRQQQR